MARPGLCLSSLLAVAGALWPGPAPPAAADPGPALPASWRAPSLRVARVLDARVARFPRFRERHPGTFRTDEAARWSIREDAACLVALAAAGVPHRPQRRTPTAVPTAVVVTGDVSGVAFRKTRDVPLIVACELAARLPTVATILRRHGVVAADVMSAYRVDPSTSFHAFGLGLDLSAFVRADGRRLEVEGGWGPVDAPHTCAPGPRSEDATTLRAIACDLAASGAFSTVLTPAYPGHDDHLHLDARPGDPRLYFL